MKWLGTILKNLFRGAGELSPSCREAARLQSQVLDHPLPIRQRIGLRVHLMLCKWCRRYGKQIRWLRTVAYDHAEELSEAAPQRLSAEARERIKQRLEKR